MLTILKRLYQQLLGGMHALLDRTKNPVNDARRILVEREGWAPYWLVSWCELDTVAIGESRTHGRRPPRRKRRKTFSFGTSNAQFSSSEAAYAAAVAYRDEVQRRHYSSSEGVGYRLDQE